jgi:hypothetical protein
VATFQQLYEEIQNDLVESLGQLTPEVKQAINDAIAFYEIHPFHFNQGAALTAFSTVVGTPNYALPPEVLILQRVLISFGGAQLIRSDYRDFDWYLDAIEGAPANRGQSTYHSVYDGQIWLYPTPNGVYPVDLYFIARLPPTPLIADAATNAWTNDARALIKARAKYKLYLHRVQNTDWAEAMALEEQVELRALRSRFARHLAPKRLVPAVW